MKRLITTTAVAALLAVAAAGAAVAGERASIGAREYTANCAVCHGAGGKGDGPYATSLTVKVPDLTVLTKNNGGVFPANKVFSLIDGRAEVAGHGPREMPVWGEDYLSQAGRQYDDYPINREAFVRGRILALIDHLYQLQVK
jgi:mono/diheme cytochrome c family protein